MDKTWVKGCKQVDVGLILKKGMKKVVKPIKLAVRLTQTLNLSMRLKIETLI